MQDLWDKIDVWVESVAILWGLIMMMIDGCKPLYVMDVFFGLIALILTLLLKNKK